jgi:stearoyl-CoA desaturase (delta-9 desaturase)
LGLGIPFVLVHLAVLAVPVIGWSASAAVVALVSYVTRGFGITLFYHRCFAHRALRVSRPVQFLGAVLGAAAAQRGPLWWVAHHRVHHRHTDRAGDPHSPKVDGFWYSHVLWIFDPVNAATDMRHVGDLARYPELRLLDRFEHVVPVTAGAGCFALGSLLAHLSPGLHTSGMQMTLWGFVLPTVLLYHSTFAVNSIAHRFGRRRFATPDESRNNWFVSALIFGEGWHNNHHRFPAGARHGLGRFELDLTWLVIRLMASLHLARDVRVPRSVLERAS